MKIETMKSRGFVCCCTSAGAVIRFHVELVAAHKVAFPGAVALDVPVVDVDALAVDGVAESNVVEMD